MNVSDKIVEILESEDVEDVFGIPGEQIMPLYKAVNTLKDCHCDIRSKF